MISSVFIGTRVEALEILKIYTDLNLIITTKDSYINKQSSNFNSDLKIVDKSSKENIFNLLSEIKVDLILSSGFPYILPSYVLKNKAIFLNSHPSLLPKYKGFYPIKEAFKNKEEHQGVTLHLMENEVDSGKIIYQKKIYTKNISLNNIYKLLFKFVEPFVIGSGLDIIKKEYNL